MEWKRDTRPAKGGWAPGDYLAHCRKCGDHFVGAKLAPDCADCAYKAPDVVKFVSRGDRQRAAMIRDARAIYESIFPSVVN